MRIDLHSHSTASDGTDSPAELMRAARQAGLDVVAITDHDTTAGWAEARAEAERIGMGLVRGIEISCARRGTSIHLLGYLIDPTHPGLLEELDKTRVSRETRAQRIVERLAQDLPITYDDVLAGVGSGATIGRPHIADALVTLGIVADRDVAFASYLRDGSRYFVSHYAPDVVTAVQLVRAAGGVPVMAHPFAAARGRTVGDEVIEEMAAAGLAGLEVHHRDHSAEAVAHGEALAASLGLFVTGSSDYHGTGKLNRLGERLTPVAVLTSIAAQATGVSLVRP
jgi:predicted metal-dependent phosphoesterase TrpH